MNSAALRLAYHTTYVSYRPYSWNLSALRQLINSGALRQMKNAELVDSSFPDQDLFGQLTWGSPYGFPSTGFLEALGDADLKLLVHDSAKVKALVNAFSKLGDQVSVRVEMGLPEHIEKAQQLINADSRAAAYSA